MNSIKKQARVAGFLYLLNGITGYFSLVYFPARVVVPGDANATGRKIIDGEFNLPYSHSERSSLPLLVVGAKVQRESSKRCLMNSVVQLTTLAVKSRSA
jgi:hypothetical protein